jgi:hypothetical protein
MRDTISTDSELRSLDLDHVTGGGGGAPIWQPSEKFSEKHPKLANAAMIGVNGLAIAGALALGPFLPKPPQ